MQSTVVGRSSLQSASITLVTVAVVVLNGLGAEVNADSTAIHFRRSDTGLDDSFAAPAGTPADPEVVEPLLQVVADSLTYQNQVIATVIQNYPMFTATAEGPSGTHTVSLKVISGASHADSMTICYMSMSDSFQENLAANITDTVEDVMAKIQQIAQDKVDTIQLMADSQSIAGITVTGNLS